MAKKFNDLPGVVQAVILSGLAIGLGVLFFFFGIPSLVRPVIELRAEREQKAAQLVQLQQENEKNRALERERAELLNRIDQLSKQLETLRTIVPDDQATDQFVKLVYDKARGSSIFLRNFVAQPLVQREYHIEMPFTVRLDGVYYQMVEMFRQLASEQRIISVVGLALGPPGGGGQGAFKILPHETVGASCTIVTYFNKPAAAPANAPPPKR
jgi:Tfp pilus assembly protein PilO